jgi:hypothetical protein
MRRLMLLFMIPLLFIAVSQVNGAIPKPIIYQGRLTNSAGTPVADGVYLVRFKIYGSEGGADSLWTSSFQSVLFTYLLGTPTALPNDLFDTDTTRYLGITVGTDAEIAPRTRMVSTAYAYQAMRSDTADIAKGVTSGSINNSDVNAAAAISPSKISGTAATLTANQTLAGDNTFTGTTSFGDSSMVVNNYGVEIGRSGTPLATYLLYIARALNTSSSRYGCRIYMTNDGTGDLNGYNVALSSNTAGAGGVATGLMSTVTTDGTRNGIYTTAEAYDQSITTGNTYGVRSLAYDGATAYGIYATASSASTNWAGYFSGNVNVTGTLSKGGGAFRIDHPLDPENKYLQHSFVESPDMMNVYNGNVTTDAGGTAAVTLPDYFETLNGDFRYQLTVIGQFAQAIIANEIANGQFVIKTDKPNVKVSWQVTGIRQDKWANANRIQVEVNKNTEERGKYLYPEVYNLPIERSVDYENIKSDLAARTKRLSGDRTSEEIK